MLKSHLCEEWMWIYEIISDKDYESNNNEVYQVQNVKQREQFFV